MLTILCISLVLHQPAINTTTVEPCKIDKVKTMVLEGWGNVDKASYNVLKYHILKMNEVK